MTASTGCDEMIRRMQPALVRYCRARIRDTGSVSADDVAQDVLIGIVDALPRYSGTAEGLEAFVYGIARNKVADFYRTYYRDMSTPMAELPECVDPAACPEQAALRAELRAQLVGLLDRLVPAQREVLTLRLIAGLSSTETAHRMSRTTGAVRIAQHRALERLRRELSMQARLSRRWPQ